MIIRTIVPKEGDQMHYLGKPVKNDKGDRIGSIIEVLEADDNYELVMEVDINV